jgi:hypothetical protein
MIGIIPQANLNDLVLQYDTILQVCRVVSYEFKQDSKGRQIPIHQYYIRLEMDSGELSSEQVAEITSFGGVVFVSDENQTAFEKYYGYINEHIGAMFVTDTNLYITLNNDSSTQMPQRLKLIETRIDNVSQTLTVYYHREQLSPNGTPVIVQPMYYSIQGERYVYWVNQMSSRTLAETFLDAIEEKLREDHASELPETEPQP